DEVARQIPRVLELLRPRANVVVVLVVRDVGPLDRRAVTLEGVRDEQTLLPGRERSDCGVVDQRVRPVAVAAHYLDLSAGRCDQLLERLDAGPDLRPSVLDSDSELCHSSSPLRPGTQ